MTTMIAKAVHAVHARGYPGLGLTACEQIARAVLTAIRDLHAQDQPIVDAMREAALAGSHDFLYDRAWSAAIDYILAEEPKP